MASTSRTYEIAHSRSATCSRETLLGVLRDPSTWPEWQSEISEARGPSPLADDDEVQGRAKLLGFEVHGRSKTITADARSFVEDVVVGVRMRVEYEVADSPNGTMVTRRLVAYLPAGVSGRLLSFFLKRRLKAMQVTALDSLVRYAEGA